MPLDWLVQDLKSGVRVLRKKPGFSLVVVAILALGIGANGAIFSLADALLLRPLPYPDSDRIVLVLGSNPRYYGDEAAPVSYPDFTDWKDQNRVFSDMAAFSAGKMNLSGGFEAERVDAFRVTEEYFSVLRINPFLGRTFSAMEFKPGRNNVVLLSRGLWQSHFGSSRDILGRTVMIEGQAHTIVGVMPAGSEPMLDPELWVPLVACPSELNRGQHFLMATARLRAGASLASARGEMEAIARRLERQYPDTDKGWGIRVDRFHEGIYGPVAPFLFILMAAAGCILLIICTNVANLLLVRGAEREKEIAIRTALGASRFRIVRQLVTESAVLALAGGCLSLLVAFWITDLIRAFITAAGLPFSLPLIRIDGRILGYTLVASLLTALIFGALPALQTSRVNPNLSLKEAGADAASGWSRRRFRGALVVAELVLSVVLLSVSALLVQGFMRLSRTDPGFQPGNLVAMSVPLSQAQYPTGSQQAEFYKKALDRISVLPGVQSAGLTSSYPMSGHNSSLTYAVAGRPKAASGEDLNACYHVVSPAYFSTLNIPLKSGRYFTEADAGDAAPVAIINETLARAQWGGQDPVGQQISIAGGPWRAIVGIIGDVRYTGLGNPVQAELCVPFAQAPAGEMELVVRTKVDPMSIVGVIRKDLRALDPGQPLTKIRPMEQAVIQSVWVERGVLDLMAGFAILAIILTALGVYGLVAHAVSRRTREIGIRIALGAAPGSVMKTVMRQGFILILAGVCLGLGASFVVTPILSAFLYGVNPTDPATFAVVAALLTGVVLLACYIPARRAMRIDPIAALRTE